MEISGKTWRRYWNCGPSIPADVPAQTYGERSRLTLSTEFDPTSLFYLWRGEGRGLICCVSYPPFHLPSSLIQKRSHIEHCEMIFANPSQNDIKISLRTNGIHRGYNVIHINLEQIPGKRSVAWGVRGERTTDLWSPVPIHLPRRYSGPARWFPSRISSNRH